MTPIPDREAAVHRASELQALLYESPLGMRASSGVWLRGAVDRLARDVLALSGCLAALETEREELRRTCVMLKDAAELLVSQLGGE